MQRRDLIRSGILAGLAAGARMPVRGAPSEGYVTLEWFRCRRDIDVQRMRGFLGDSVLPAYNRSGIKPVGVFQPMVGPDSPSFLVVAPYTSMAAVQETKTKLAQDERWAKDLTAFEEKWELAYERRESFLLRGFRTFPGIETPKVEAGKTNVFELRIYESRNTTGHEKKVAMFDSGEIDIFRRVGVNPVFFGSAIFGTRMPNLTYMVYYPTWEARAEAWSKFANDPEWKKLSTAPGNVDRELVSSISNQLMSALPFSQLK